MMERIGDWVVCAFSGVTNTQQLLAEGTGAPSCCLIDGTMVLSKLQLAAAIQRLSYRQHFRTKSLVSELVLMISPTKNISEATENFCCPADSAIVVMALHKPLAEEVARASSAVAGSPISLDALGETADKAKLARVYGVTPAELRIGSLEEAIVARIATSDV